MNTPAPTRPDSTAVRTVRAASPAPRRRVLVCPPAGSGARALGAFVAAQPLEVEVLGLQYPGRGDRRAEEGARDVPALAADLAAELAPWAADPLPLIVVGHSYGAAIAFELTRCLELDGLGPTALVVSGRPSPSAGLGLPVPRDDDDVVAELRRVGAVSAAVLDRPSMRRSIVSVLRADFHANATFRVGGDATVTAPVTVLLAAEDPYVDEAGARGWAAHTTGEFRVETFPGGHDFLDEAPEPAVAVLPREPASA